MHKLVVVMMISFLLSFSGCITNPTASDSDSSASLTPYAGIYSGTETFKSGVFPLKIHISTAGKIKIVDVDNLAANGQLEGDKFTVKRYGSSPMVFKGTIIESKISGITYGNRFLGNGTFEATLSE